MIGPVLLTGATGFVGSALAAHFLARDIPVTAVIRGGGLPPHPGLRIVVGDLFDPAVLDRAADGCSAVIHLVGIIKEHPAAGTTFHHIHVEGTQAVLAAAGRKGIRRYLHMSALGARPGADCDYHRTKYAAEQLVQASGLDWTIFRPSLIHGPGGEFMDMETGWAQGSIAPYLFMPYFGRGLLGRGGGGRVQPIYVRDVARAFAEAMDNPQTINRIYCLGGEEKLTWPSMHGIVAQAVVGRARPSLAVPAWYARLLTSIVPAAWIPFNRDQVVMSQEENTCDMSAFVRDFGWTPGSFSATSSQYLSQ